jgi:hypothetical protein
VDRDLDTESLQAGLRETMDALVGRLGELADGLSDAARNGTPGAYLLPEEVAARGRRAVDPRPPLATDPRSAALGLAFGLSPLELDLVLIAAAADLDDRIESLVGYVNDDLTRRRATVGLSARLCGVALDDPALREAIGPRGRLRSHGLVELDEPTAPLPSRPVRCSERVVDWLVGLDAPPAVLARLIADPPPAPGEEAQRVGAAIEAGLPLHYVLAPPGTDPRGIGAAAAGVVGAASLVLDLDRLGPGVDLDDVRLAALREARLRAAVLVAGPIDPLIVAGTSLEPWAESGWPVILHGTRTWDPTWSRHAPVVVDAPAVLASAQIELWQQLLGELAPPLKELADAASTFRLTGEQVASAATAALAEGAASGRRLDADDIRRSARARNTGALERLARRVQPEASWSDLVLPTTTIAKLQELVAGSRHRELVYRTWGLGGTGHRGDGMSALFAGPSGTGKTLAAEVVAGALGLDLYIVDLSTVVDKFIGETEKNLERIFDGAERVNGVVVFDEADALFSKRSEVKDSHDRYANLETAYLLQRMEVFSGTAILTTNLRSNLDDAFTRRLGSLVTFPIPDAAARFLLWQRFLGEKVPIADEVDLRFCADRFELTGANIRNVSIAAAFFAAEDGPPVQMHDIVKGLEREYEKLGRLRTKAEFKPYEDLLSESPEPGQ